MFAVFLYSCKRNETLFVLVNVQSSLSLPLTVKTTEDYIIWRLVPRWPDTEKKMTDLSGQEEDYSVWEPLRDSLWRVVAHLPRGMLVDKNVASEDMAFCQGLPPTEESRLTCTEDAVIKSKRGREEKEEKEMRESKILCFSWVKWNSKTKKVTTRERREEQKRKSECRSGEQTAEDCTIWILIGEGYLRPGIALVLWQQIQKGFGCPPQSGFGNKNNCCFPTLASCVSLNHPQCGFQLIGN